MYRNLFAPSLLVGALALTLTSCGQASPEGTSTVERAESTHTNSSSVASQPASSSASVASQPASIALPAACAKDALPVKKPGRLTIGTDKPGYPPYIVDDDPTNGKGFESALAYAVAGQLGFAKDEVAWMVVPFNSSYAPGPKSFDFDINQIGINADRRQGADFSDPYYHAPQAIVTLEGSKIVSATTLAELATAKLGVQIGTTTLDAVKAVIHPTNDVQVFDDTAAATAALKNGNVDGIAADLPTAIYLRDAVLEKAKVLGTFSAQQGDNWGLLFEKGSPLVPCVNEALRAIKASGELDRITHEWMDASANAPELR